jgi:hypothetical protein
MSIKISNLAAISGSQIISSTTAIFPIVANPTGPLTTYQTSLANVKAAISHGNLNITGCITAQSDSLFSSNLVILGNLIVQGNTSTIGSNNVSTTDNILELHVANTANVAQPWTVDDGKDIGVRFHYFAGTNQNAALLMANDTKWLEWYSTGSEGNSTFVGTSYGTFKAGEIKLANTTATTNSATGALVVAGGIATSGNLWVNSNIDGQGYISTIGNTTTANLQVNSTATIGTTLKVGSTATVNSLAVNTVATISSTLVVQGNTTVDGLSVNTSSVVNNTLQAKGGIQNTPIGNGTASTGSFTSINVNGTATGGNLVSTGTFVVATTSALNGTVSTNNILPFGNANANIGSSVLQYNTIFAKATSAQYADLAEKYVADAEYEPGTVVIFGGSEEITTTTVFADSRVAGIISTDPAYLMNSGSPGLPVALRGKVPVKVVGQVFKGDLLVTSAIAGYAESARFRTDYNPLAVVAKSLVDDRGYDERVIVAVVL